MTRLSNPSLRIAALAAACLMLAALPGCPSRPAPDDAQTAAQEQNAEAPALSGEESEKPKVLQCLYVIEDEELEASVTGAEPVEEAADTHAVILPHYANALYMCSELFSGVERDIELVVIAGPNHEAQGESIQISGSDWYWSSAYVSGDPDAARLLAAASGAVLSDRVISQDWSVQTLIPYVHRFFPQAKVVTVLLSRGAQDGDLAALAEALKGLGDERELLFVGSADFSHYLDPDTAAKNDEVTVSYIEQGEFAGLLNLDNGYIDSPETAVLAMRYSQLLGSSMHRSARLFERYWEDGHEKAGSYYSFCDA